MKRLISKVTKGDNFIMTYSTGEIYGYIEVKNVTKKRVMTKVVADDYKREITMTTVSFLQQSAELSFTYNKYTSI